MTRPRCQPAAGPDSAHMTSVTLVLSSWIFQVMLGVLPRMYRSRLYGTGGGGTRRRGGVGPKFPGNFGSRGVKQPEQCKPHSDTGCAPATIAIRIIGNTVDERGRQPSVGPSNGCRWSGMQQLHVSVLLSTFLPVTEALPNIQNLEGLDRLGLWHRAPVSHSTHHFMARPCDTTSAGNPPGSTLGSTLRWMYCDCVGHQQTRANIGHSSSSSNTATLRISDGTGLAERQYTYELKQRGIVDPSALLSSSDP